MQELLKMHNSIYSNLKITVEETEVFVAVCDGFVTVIKISLFIVNINENYKLVRLLYYPTVAATRYF